MKETITLNKMTDLLVKKKIYILKKKWHNLNMQLIVMFVSVFDFFDIWWFNTFSHCPLKKIFVTEKYLYLIFY